ncbi:MAG: DNA primase [Symploca sp. SIO1A3]|nr:DNA primase [Symploca sp. SIO1A3]
MDIPRLHPDTIEEVKQRAEIVDVISEHVVLRKSGKDYLGLCPFHDEKTPSFSVSPTKQMYYCFGCQAGGNAIKFLMEVGKHSFSEVVLGLARRYQVPVQTLEPAQRQELQRQLSLREQLYEIMALTAQFYQHALRHRQGQQALEYLHDQRGLQEETIQQFQLGYAPAGWDTLYKYLVEQKGKPVQQVAEAGLIKPRNKGNGYYDSFRDRLIIPIRDTQGRVIGLGGRSLGNEQPKYLNSPETPLFNKGKILFALDKARDSIRKQDQAVVVEGYFDAIALHAVGITNVVASLGTALSQEQVRQLLRYTESKQIILNFDADAAGTKATAKAIGEIAHLAYQGQVQLRVLNLPDGKDADEFLQGHSEAQTKYQQLLQTAPLWLDWQISQLLKDKNLQQADQFQHIAQEMVKLLNQIDNVNQLTYYLNHCAQCLSQGQDRLVPLYLNNLQAQLKNPLATNNKKPPILRQPSPSLTQKKSKSQKSTPSQLNSPIDSEHILLEKAEALLLGIYLHCPEYRQMIIDSLETEDLLFSLSHHRFLWQQILGLQEIAAKSRTNTSNSLISLLQESSLKFPEEMAQVAHLFHPDEKLSKDLTRASVLIPAATACLETVVCEKHRRYCLQQWQKLNPATDYQRMQYYWRESNAVKKRIQELEKTRLNNSGYHSLRQSEMLS